jgi:hypothetical protein
MLQTHILLIFFAVLDFHFANPPLSTPCIRLFHSRILEGMHAAAKIISKLRADKELEGQKRR